MRRSLTRPALAGALGVTLYVTGVVLGRPVGRSRGSPTADSAVDRADQSRVVSVAAVVDGDTLRLDSGEYVRVLGVDTPETRNPNFLRPQALGAAATQFTADAVRGSTVRIERDVSDRDHYGRLLRHVWVGARLLAEDLVEAGLGRATPQAPDLRYAARLRAAEARARAARRGIWGLHVATPLPVFGSPVP